MTTDTAAYHFARDLPLPPDQLWHLLTDGTMRERWGAPSEGTVLTMTRSDFRVGGAERHRCGPAEAPEFEVATHWYRIDAPTDAVFTETIEAGGQSIATSLVTYRVAASGSGSALAVTVAVSSFVGPEAPQDFREGWEGGLNNLARLAKEVAA